MTPRIVDYVKTVAEFRNRPLPSGATSETIALAEQDVGTQFPQQLRDWLAFCNGSQSLLPAKYFGVGKPAGEERIDALYVMRERFPEFMDLDWFPIADDGCGNFWVLPLRGNRHPVIFIDHENDMDKGKYVAGSDLDHFLEMILEQEILHNRDFDWRDLWPGNEEFVKSRDPNIAAYEGVPCIWEKGGR